MNILIQMLKLSFEFFEMYAIFPIVYLWADSM